MWVGKGVSAMLKNNPVVKKLMETGEEGIGKLTQQLLSNENFMAAIQTVVTRSLAAKETVEKSLRSALTAMNLPSSDDVRALQERVNQLEELVRTMDEKMDRLGEAKPGAKKK